ncbi:MAG: bifunctional 5,10-methylenetetrahydrofolate dehydrogenase/5,10-methenyltetrahydrofolate cyclohydrolase [Acidaminococcaceae bacterium]|nr:bifunctional 5,10-methylenetetrahydrofolate dehydrogenase/5,10-methenyltetrahydrofolate cyclohydrolase [Acidaminococcaceae bacterium]
MEKRDMQTIWIDGRAMAKEIQADVAKRVRRLTRVPKLVVIWVGNNPASAVYVAHKQKVATEIGMQSEVLHLPETTSLDELRNQIELLNQDSNVDGILVQLPLPKHLDSDVVLETISPDKDVDGLTSFNLGRLICGQPQLMPCTPMACMRMIESVEPDLTGKLALVIGRSRLVGKPLFQMLLTKNCTVMQAHTKTENLSALSRQADLVVVATGPAGLIGVDDIKIGAIVIDVGISKQPDGSIKGDVRSDEIDGVAYAATPVPGGVGPMTVAMLMENTVKAAEMHQGIY